LRANRPHSIFDAVMGVTRKSEKLFLKCKVPLLLV